MPNYIALRLTPAAAIDAATFTTYLTNLTINVYDISYGNANRTGGVPIGSASLTAGTIVQHTNFQNLALPPASVATAMIPYTPPGPEYVAPDLRVEFVLATGQTVDAPNIYYNVPLYSPTADYQAVPPSGVSAYVTVPAPVPSGAAPALQLPSDGTPPKFADLWAAVTAVVGQDPGSATPAVVAALTLEQCRNIAYEIVYGPQTALPSPNSTYTLEDMYTDGPNTGTASDGNEQARAGFQGALSAYYAPQNATAEQLTTFVFSLAAALACEQLSTTKDQAILEFPADPNGSGNLATAGEVEVILTGATGTIDVPAEVFYALTAQLPPQITVAQRFTMATGASEQQNLTQLTNLVNSGWMSSAAPTGLFLPNSTMNPAQAVRILAALNVPASSTVTTCPIAAIAPIWTDWLAYPLLANWTTFQAGSDDTVFWPAEATAQPAAFLNLVLIALTQDYTIPGGGMLKDAIIAHFALTSVIQLAAVTPAQWQTFFNGLPVPVVLTVPTPTAVLPAFFGPGTLPVRIAAFIRYFQSFFGVQASTATPTAPTLPAIATLGLPSFDVIAQTIAAYPGFAFGPTVTLGQLNTAAGTVFGTVLPNDPQAQAWAVQAIWTLNQLFILTQPLTSLPSPAPTLRFSAMEALFARGFTSATDVLDLPSEDFQQALTGTVAYDFAGPIYTNAGTGHTCTATAPPTFTPINPGCLTDCVPPLYLSPLGPLAYLQEMLMVAESSTCESPFPPDAQGHTGPPDLGNIIATRRGPIATTLLATRANLETPIPLIDLVNECLEYAASTTPPAKQGMVYNTSGDALGGHTLCVDECCEKEKDTACGEPACHNPATLFAGLPEYSTPATPISAALRFKDPGFSNADVEPAVYDILKQDFSSCCLPYSQALDVSRTYLEHFRTCRFEVMRTYRKCITEYVLDPAKPPAGFRPYLWRYPVRIDIAIEYLEISPEEFIGIFGGVWPPVCDAPCCAQGATVNPPTNVAAQSASQLYGLNVDETLEDLLPLPEFLKRTCLTYCEFLDLWKCGFVPFGNSQPGGEFPECEPCCLKELQINSMTETALRELAVFIRLWRKLKKRCGGGYSFQQLADICTVVPLFQGNGVNPDFIRQLAAFQMLRDQLRLKLTDDCAVIPAGASGADRMFLLSLWAGTGHQWDWAFSQFLGGIAHYAMCRFHCERREPEFVELLAGHLDCIARLAGFDPATPSATWFAAPAHTLRFAEILAKIYASKFTVGEILFLFTGDDALCPAHPIEHHEHDATCERPDDDHEKKHWHSRRKLLEKHVPKEESEDWMWSRLESAIHHEFGCGGAQPNLQRQQAMFDCWERIFDYDRARKERRERWEGGLCFFQDQGVPVYALTTADLEDDGWAVRCGHADRWIESLARCFRAKDIAVARPELWASDIPSAVVAGETVTGNANLSQFLGDGLLETCAPRLYDDLKTLNDGLRQRGRCALIAYLCGANGIVASAKELSDLLLLDVETGLCERASRVEEAITAVQTFIQRCRIGLETTWTISPQFAHMWDSRFANYHVWQACKRRELYKENWIDWHELEKAQKIESFRFMDEELRRVTLTIAAPGGVDYWPDQRPPLHSGLCLLQDRDPATMQLLPAEHEGLALLATPERDGRTSWITTGPPAATAPPNPAPASGCPLPPNLPVWMECAIKLGTRFYRVAAAGYPPASTPFEPWKSPHPLGEAPGTSEECCVDCCSECGCRHPAHVDEYYFWLVDSRHFDPAGQGAHDGNSTFDAQQDSYYDPSVQESTPWHDPTQLPNLLAWPSEPMVRLRWCRVHNGEFQQQRTSVHGVVGGTDISFSGRAVDSLYFTVAGSPTSAFRFDLAEDSAHVITSAQLTAAFPPSPAPGPGGLPAYPYFAYYTPGARLFPWSMYSPAIAVANALRAHCRFEAALKWYDLYYDPLSQDNTWAKCLPDGTTQSTTTCCDSTDVSCHVARDRSVLLQYVETLVEWGDALMRRDSPEQFQQARVIFDSARRILGKAPHKIANPAGIGAKAVPVGTFVPLPAPVNPRLMMLYDRLDDRMALIHHCLDQRRLRQASERHDAQYWGHDPVREGWRRENCHCCDEGDCHPHSPYRFTFLIQKAKELANQTRELGGALLAAFEKGDAEYLASLRADHERTLLVLGREIRENEWRDGDFQAQALQKTKESDQASRRYYANLIAVGNISDENNYVTQTGVALGFRDAGNISEAIGQLMVLIPDTWFGTVEAAQIPVGSKLAGLFGAIARVLNALADNASTKASLDLTDAGWVRRWQDWNHQVQILDIQIEQMELQILGAERRRHNMLRQLNNQQLQIEQSTEVLNFLRDKFSNHAVYLFLQKNTADLYYQVYELAVSAAREAERAFHFERGHVARKFVSCDAWDNLHEGLLAGERLQLSLAAMEKDYCDHNRREYELTKHISLRLQFPMEFLRLKLTGRCEIDLAEWRFDQDYPGHYMRRIKNATLTIPSVSGPYNGVHCRLTLLGSSTRVDPLLSLAPARCCHKCKAGHGYEMCPHDPRMVKDYAATEAIATSSGQNDSGLFELNFHDDRYLPFEFHGAVSKWRIELPPDNNYFDMDTLSDVILHLNYTAREGGDRLRQAAREAAEKRLPGAGWCLFDVRHDFPDAWEMFRAGHGDKRHRQLNLKFGRNLFPFVPGHRDLRIEQMALLFHTGVAPHHRCPNPCAGECGCGRKKCHASWDVDFQPAGDCETVGIRCAQSEDWRDLYHGVVDTDLGPLGRNGDRPEARLRFPAELDEIGDVYLLCRYAVACHCRGKRTERSRSGV
jgi:hypothetical protein